jgi:hypothetical protein
MDDETALAEFPLEDGSSVFVEVTPTAGETRVARGDAITKARVTFEEAVGQVRNAAVAALDQFRQMASQPDQVEISFGVKLTTDVGAVLAKAGVEGQLAVKLTWRAPTQQATGEQPGHQAARHDTGGGLRS